MGNGKKSFIEGGRMVGSILIVFIAFYLGMGIGNAIKHLEKMKAPTALALVFLIPLQTLIGTAMLCNKTYKLCRNEVKKTKEPTARVKMHIMRIVLETSVKYMPTFASAITLDILAKNRPSFHNLKRTKNRCANNVCRMLGYCCA